MEELKLNTIDEALDDFREGKFVIVVDDEDREKTARMRATSSVLPKR